MDISIFKKAIISLNLRISGQMFKTYNNMLQDIKQCLRIIETIKPSTNNPWLTVHENYLKDKIKMFKILRFIPASFVPSDHKDLNFNATNKFTENGRMKCKDITLPAPSKKIFYESSISFHVIMDSLFTYLLDDLNQEILYSIFTEHLNEGPYEYKTVRLEKGDIVIDAGANIGEFSALAGIKGCAAYAFEPIPNIIDTYLSKTAEWNPNITICKYALSDKRGELIFEENLSNLGGSSYVREVKNSNKIKVQAIDLDSFVEENKLPRVDFIKADIEGAERYMLMGAKRVLKEFAPKIAICTYHLPDDPQVLRELILDANPNYVIEERWKKMYAFVPIG